MVVAVVMPVTVTRAHTIARREQISRERNVAAVLFNM
jgi:hypothetical protein